MPARLGQLVRALATFGVRVEEPSSGSHWKAYAADGRMYTLPASHGMKTELSDIYIRSMCRSLGIDEKKLRALL